jgi:hypothetical protein
VKALRQMGLNTPGLKWQMVEEASIGGVCICDKCEIECIEVWECKECDERETAGEGSEFVLCKKCYASLRSGDGSVLHNAGHTFEFQELGHGEGEVQSLSPARQGTGLSPARQDGLHKTGVGQF